MPENKFEKMKMKFGASLRLAKYSINFNSSLKVGV